MKEEPKKYTTFDLGTFDDSLRKTFDEAVRNEDVLKRFDEEFGAFEIKNSFNWETRPKTPLKGFSEKQIKSFLLKALQAEEKRVREKDKKANKK